MRKIAVIIKHPYRSSDFRIDIYDIPNEISDYDLIDYVNSQMLGPFEIIGLSERITFGCKMKLQDN